MSAHVAPQAFLPMRPLELLVLAMLAERSMHGYAIRQAILEHTGGDIEVEAGNLYRHIRRLDEETLVDLAPGPAGEDERRRYFRITALGRRVLAAELARLRTLVSWGEERGLLARARP